MPIGCEKPTFEFVYVHLRPDKYYSLDQDVKHEGGGQNRPNKGSGSAHCIALEQVKDAEVLDF